MSYLHIIHQGVSADLLSNYCHRWIIDVDTMLIQWMHIEIILNTDAGIGAQKWKRVLITGAIQNGVEGLLTSVCENNAHRFDFLDISVDRYICWQHIFRHITMGAEGHMICFGGDPVHNIFPRWSASKY